MYKKKYLALYLLSLSMVLNNALEAKGLKLVGHKENPVLSSLKPLELMYLGKHKGDRKVLDFSGMVYSPVHHKVYAFGGGHATITFPNSVHEFDFKTLQWKQITPDVPLSAYTGENSVRNSKGEVLGGVKWKEKIWAGSRHTYDGLVSLTDGRIVSAQAQEFQGANIKDYRINYQNARGLWFFDPLKKEWSVSKKANLATPYAVSAYNPNQPEIVYMGNSASLHSPKQFFKVNIKTERIEYLAPAPRSQNDTNLVYFPEHNSIFLFIDVKGDKKANIFEYSIKNNIWSPLNPKGIAPKLYSVAVVYDSKHKIFSSFAGGKFHYYNPITNQWSTVDRAYDTKRLYHHLIYNPVDHVYLLCDTEWQTYVFKFVDKID